MVVLELEAPMRLGKCKVEAAAWTAVRFSGRMKLLCEDGVEAAAITLATAARKLLAGPPFSAEAMKLEVKPACSSPSRLGLP